MAEGTPLIIGTATASPGEPSFFQRKCADDECAQFLIEPTMIPQRSLHKLDVSLESIKRALFRALTSSASLWIRSQPFRVRFGKDISLQPVVNVALAILTAVGPVEA